MLATTTVNTGTGSRPDRIGSGVLPSGQRPISHWFDQTAFASPAPFLYGNAGRDILFGPGRTNLDTSLFKDFRPLEQLTVQFRAEAFNLMNHPQFGQPEMAPSETVRSARSRRSWAIRASCNWRSASFF